MVQFDALTFFNQLLTFFIFFPLFYFFLLEAFNVNVFTIYAFRNNLFKVEQKVYSFFYTSVINELVVKSK